MLNGNIISNSTHGGGAVPPNPTNTSSSSFNPADWHDWFHEKASRSSADLLLKGTPAGTFLVRQSIRVPGDLVLTVSEPPKIKHYLVTKIQTQFKIGDQIFDTMGELLQFYTRHKLDTATLKIPMPTEQHRTRHAQQQQPQFQQQHHHSQQNHTNFHNNAKPAQEQHHQQRTVNEASKTPVQNKSHSPKPKTIQNPTVIGMYDFESNDPDDLPFKKGDVLEIVIKQEDQWWTAKNVYGRTGHIPVPYVKVIESNSRATSCADTQQPSSLNGLDEETQLYKVIIRRVPNAYDKNALALDVGDTIQVFRKPSTGQWNGKNMSTGREGMFPFTHVTPVHKYVAQQQEV